MAQDIDKTVYSDLKTAIRKKKELAEEHKNHGWDVNQKECGETLGIIAALEEALENGKDAT